MSKKSRINQKKCTSRSVNSNVDTPAKRLLDQLKGVNPFDGNMSESEYTSWDDPIKEKKELAKLSKPSIEERLQQKNMKKSSENKINTNQNQEPVFRGNWIQRWAARMLYKLENRRKELENR